jgi:ankyrin repeat protein
MLKREGVEKNILQKEEEIVVKKPKIFKINIPTANDTYQSAQHNNVNSIDGHNCMSPERSKGKKRKMQTPLPPKRPVSYTNSDEGEVCGVNVNNKTNMVDNDSEEQYYAYTHTPKRKKVKKNFVDEKRQRKSSFSSNHAGGSIDNRRRSRHVSFSDTSDNGIGSDSDRSRSSSLVGVPGTDMFFNNMHEIGLINKNSSSDMSPSFSSTSTTINQHNVNQLLNGMTPLLLACRRGSVDHVRSLIKSKLGGNINHRDDRDFDSLMYAARDGFTEVVRVLISEGGANANATSKDGFSPLMYASLCGYPETAKVLIEANAVVDSVDNTGFTSLMGASQNGHRETVETLLKCGANPNLVDSNGYSALVHASLHGCFQVVEPLLKYGAKVDSRTKFGSTALMHAAHGAQVEMVKCLLDGNANPKLKDAVGNTPLSLVARSVIVERAGTTKEQLIKVWKLLQPVSDQLDVGMRRRILRKLLGGKKHHNNNNNSSKALIIADNGSDVR